jgi:hypothetical protein
MDLEAAESLSVSEARVGVEPICGRFQIASKILVRTINNKILFSECARNHMVRNLSNFNI